jgi:hypothetical protein
VPASRPAGFWIVAALAGSSLLTLLLGLCTRLDPIPLGLRAEHTPAAVPGVPDAGTIIDPAPSTHHLLEEWNGAPADVFSEAWTGAVFPLRDGTYRFEADSDGSSEIVIDGQPVVGPIHLASGAHSLLLRYAHREGPIRFNFLWARGDEALTPVPAWALRPRKIRGAPRLLARMALDRGLALSEWVWVSMLVLAAAALARAGLVRLGRSLERACAWRTLIWILAASFVLNAAGIWWGLPGSWVAIELKPVYVLGALSQHFSHGWFDAYPPVHFYVLSAAWSPLLLLSWMDRLTFDGTAGYASLVLTSRAVSLIMAAGIVAAACLCATRAFGRRAGLFAAAIFALTTPFLYYAKTANVDVPYVFWWALSMVLYLQLLQTGQLRDYLAFAAAATLSVCTKDQAYGLYLLPPLVIVEQIWRTNRANGVRGAFWRAVVDRRLIAAAAASGVLFALCQNLLFNRGGFIEHVRFITGPGSSGYRVYEPTAAGHLSLLRETLRLIEISMGWPMTLAGAAGLTMAIADARLRRIALWLLVPVVSYYLGFINLVLYNYDRFVLPMCFILAIFGGLAFDRLLSTRSRGPSTRLRAGRGWKTAAAAAAFAYTLLYAGTVDVLMIEDSRYDVERWMSAHVGRREIVGVSGLHEYMPRLDEFHLEEILTIAELQQEHPEYVVLNADYARAVPPETGWGEMIAALQHGTAGYRRVGLFRHAAPWPWLPSGHPDLVGARQETIVFSTLRNINPTIEIFQRVR